MYMLILIFSHTLNHFLDTVGHLKKEEEEEIKSKLAEQKAKNTDTSLFLNRISYF